ncbi:MAG: DUF5678 domain-containing protein [Nitrososphaerales archaeon]
MPLLLDKAVESLIKFRKDMKWFQDHYEDLKKQYPDKYVAVHDGEVVDHDKTYIHLIQRLKKRYADISSFVVEYVSGERQVRLIV